MFKGENKIYLVAETKNTGKGIQAGVDEEKLDESERMKIDYARKHFKGLQRDYKDLDYRVCTESGGAVCGSIVKFNLWSCRIEIDCNFN
ncbi:Restriction endonuclease [Mannheimia haemolytica]|uniref:Restriction endonuclease n=1 Tax=Mannheimia haemolytica TaxID=75985 RepID=A0A378N8L9_MANHA|nr:Restriction endonuclease [Mannheimia haemolytica]